MDYCPWQLLVSLLSKQASCHFRKKPFISLSTKSISFQSDCYCKQCTYFESVGEVSAIQVQNSKLLLICGFGGSINSLSIFSQSSHAQIREGSACQEVACFHKFTGLPVPNRELRGCIILIKVLDIRINFISCLLLRRGRRRWW